MQSWGGKSNNLIMINGMKDLTGQRFGRLVAVQPERERKNAHIVWLCQCDCGNTTSVVGSHLSSGNTRSCGCLNRETASQVGRNRAIDITRQRFNRWLVLGRAPEQGGDRIYWTCKCDCGTIRNVDGASLRYGESRSCGCLQAEIAAEMLSKKRGPKNSRWNSNLTEEDRKNGRDYSEYREWRIAVYKRDRYRCQKCGDDRGGNLVAHHIESYDTNKDLRTTLENGITLCKKHHDDFHHQYGKGNNTREQFDEFMLKEDCNDTIS